MLTSKQARLAVGYLQPGWSACQSDQHRAGTTARIRPRLACLQALQSVLLALHRPLPGSQLLEPGSRLLLPPLQLRLRLLHLQQGGCIQTGSEVGRVTSVSPLLQACRSPACLLPSRRAPPAASAAAAAAPAPARARPRLAVAHSPCSACDPPPCAPAAAAPAAPPASAPWLQRQKAQTNGGGPYCCVWAVCMLHRSLHCRLRHAGQARTAGAWQDMGPRSRLLAGSPTCELALQRLQAPLLVRCQQLALVHSLGLNLRHVAQPGQEASSGYV